MFFYSTRAVRREASVIFGQFLWCVDLMLTDLLLQDAVFVVFCLQMFFCQP